MVYVWRIYKPVRIYSGFVVQEQVCGPLNRHVSIGALRNTLHDALIRSEYSASGCESGPKGVSRPSKPNPMLSNNLIPSDIGLLMGYMSKCCIWLSAALQQRQDK